MSEVINLAKGNGDDHVYEEAACILSSRLERRYSFVINNWNRPLPKTNYPIIFISTSDETHQMPNDMIERDDVAYIFKQYHPMSNMDDVNSIIYNRKVFGIPLCHLKGVKNLNIPINDRSLDWTFMGQFDPYRRVDFKRFVDQLEENKRLRYKCLWYEGWNNGIDKAEYSSVLNNSKVALVPRGSASRETFRFFEAMMCGCAVVGVDLPRVEFYNKANYTKIDNWTFAADEINKLLQDKTNLAKLSQDAYDWYEYYCSPLGLARYMERRIEK
jgi:hypothetical protein